MKTSFLKRNRKNQRGSAMTEFALGAFILTYAFTGTFQWGYTFYVYNNIQNAVNDGAKYAALRVYENTTAPPSTCFSTAVKNMVTYGDPSGNTTTPIAPGLTPFMVTVTPAFSNGIPSSMTVGITGYTINAVMGSTTLTNKPQMTYPFLGRYAPGETCQQ